MVQILTSWSLTRNNSSQRR